MKGPATMATSVVFVVRNRKYGQKGYYQATSGFHRSDLPSTERSMARKKQPSELTLCPAVGFSQIVGGTYKLRILWVLIQKPYRYGEKGTLGKPVTPRVLSRELKELQLRGLIHRKQYNVVPPKVEYSLTDLGRGLQPVLQAIVEWGLTGAHEEILGIDVQ
jgi:DNA-binding HxlR family transcriptional regulator